ncbi:MAG: hypothetical protein J2O44_02255 [Porphyrobacter sp.]|nr:hypothetical protein [Porphyrobacter sp.]
MTYKGDPIAEKLDKLAEATGMPRLQRKFAKADPLRFRVLPLGLLGLAVAGLAAQMAWPFSQAFWLVGAAWFATVMVYGNGPMWRSGKLDEREAAVVRHGHFVGMMWALGVAVLGSLTIAFGQMGAMLRLWDLWAPRTGIDWMVVTLFLLVIEANVAVLAAGAATPEPLEDEED